MLNDAKLLQLASSAAGSIYRDFEPEYVIR
jgi:hypothetical protein